VNPLTFLRVSAHVLLQRSGLGKILQACLALERPVASVRLGLIEDEPMGLYYVGK
jgi:hypothetical protein